MQGDGTGLIVFTGSFSGDDGGDIRATTSRYGIGALAVGQDGRRVKFTLKGVYKIVAARSGNFTSGLRRLVRGRSKKRLCSGVWNGKHDDESQDFGRKGC